MKLTVNGEDRILENSSGAFSVASFIESLNMKSDRVAVELNRDILPRDRWSETRLQDGDRLEIVHFVGGG